VRKVSLKLLAHVGCQIFVKQVTQLGNEIMATNHAFTPAFDLAKYVTIDSRSMRRPRNTRAFKPGTVRPKAFAASVVDSSSRSLRITATRYLAGSFITSFSTNFLNSSREYELSGSSFQT